MPTKRQRRKRDVKQNQLGFIRNSLLKVDIVNIFVDVKAYTNLCCGDHIHTNQFKCIILKLI